MRSIFGVHPGVVVPSAAGVLTAIFSYNVFIALQDRTTRLARDSDIPICPPARLLLLRQGATLYGVILGLVLRQTQSHRGDDIKRVALLSALASCSIQLIYNFFSVVHIVKSNDIPSAEKRACSEEILLAWTAQNLFALGATTWGVLCAIKIGTAMQRRDA